MNFSLKFGTNFVLMAWVKYKSELLKLLKLCGGVSSSQIRGEQHFMQQFSHFCCIFIHLFWIYIFV